MVSALVPDRAVRIRAYAEDTVALSMQEYVWVPANCLGNLINCEGVSNYSMLTS